jgi:hypothetical protein
MKQSYHARLKAAESMSFSLNPDEALDRWLEEHYLHTRPCYLSIASQVPIGLCKLCVQRGFEQLERSYQSIEGEESK